MSFTEIDTETIDSIYSNESYTKKDHNSCNNTGFMQICREGFNECDFTGVTFKDEIDESWFKRTSFTKSSIESNVSRTEFFKGIFTESTFRSIRIEDSSFIDVLFKRNPLLKDQVGIFRDTDLASTLIEKCSFNTGTLIQECIFKGAKISSTYFTGVSFKENYCEVLDIKNCIFQDCNVVIENERFEIPYLAIGSGTLTDECLESYLITEYDTYKKRRPLVVDGEEGGPNCPYTKEEDEEEASSEDIEDNCCISNTTLSERRVNEDILNAKFLDVDLEDSEFIYSNIYNSIFDKVKFINTNFKEEELHNVSIVDCTFKHKEDCNFHEITFCECEITDSKFIDAELLHNELAGNLLESTIFKGTTFKNVTFRKNSCLNVTIEDCRFINCNMDSDSKGIITITDLAVYSEDIDQEYLETYIITLWEKQEFKRKEIEREERERSQKEMEAKTYHTEGTFSKVFEKPILGQTYKDVKFEHSRFDDIRINRTRFERVNITETTFEEVALQGSIFDETNFKENSIISYCEIEKSYFTHCNFEDTKIKSNDLKNCKFENINFKECFFRDNTLKNSQLTNCYFKNCKVELANGSYLEIDSLLIEEEKIGNASLEKLLDIHFTSKDTKISTGTISLDGTILTDGNTNTNGYTNQLLKETTMTTSNKQIMEIAAKRKMGELTTKVALKFIKSKTPMFLRGYLEYDWAKALVSIGAGILLEFVLNRNRGELGHISNQATREKLYQLVEGLKLSGTLAITDKFDVDDIIEQVCDQIPNFTNADVKKPKRTRKPSVKKEEIKES